VLSRRTLLSNLALVVSAPMINRGRFRLFAASVSEYSAQAIDIVQSATVIDMLSLLTLDFKKLSAWQDRPEGFRDSDFQNLKDSGITVFHPAVGYTEGDVHAASLADLTRWNLLIAGRPRDFLRIDNAADLGRVKTSGKIGILLGQQNSAHFRSVDDVELFYKMGQRVSQLTYDPNRIGGGSSNPRDPGLTEFGAQIIDRMNQVGMAIDVSHCGDRTTLDAVAASRKPVLITHSNCRAINPNVARCKTDEAITRVAARGGVMGVTMIRLFCKSRGPATIEDLLDHIDHIVNLAGAEHAGIGSDVDLEGRDGRAPEKRTFVDGIHYAKKIFDVTEGLIRRNYTPGNIRLILGGNFQRALAEIWASASKLLI
jgi:membrane dipeptidase